MIKLKVVDVINNPCLLAPEKGKIIADLIKASLEKHDFLVVDFTGYEFLSSAFMNHALGQICIDLDLDKNTFQEKIKIEGLQDDDIDDVTLAIDNAQLRRRLHKKGVSPEEYYSTRLPA